MAFAQYDTATGFIAATNSQKVDDDVLAAIGRAQIEIPDDTDLLNSQIDLTTLQVVPLQSGG